MASHFGLRLPFTQAEIRQNEALEVRGYVRAKRRRNMLPNAYDDHGRGDTGDRTWKRHRGQQWKADGARRGVMRRAVDFHCPLGPKPQGKDCHVEG